MKEMYNKVKDKTNANYYVMKIHKNCLKKSTSEQNEQKLVFLYF